MVAAEDTRRTRGLLSHLGGQPQPPQLSRSFGRAPARDLLDILRSGRDVALVSDAGTPSVSDPGADLVGAGACSRHPGRAGSGPLGGGHRAVRSRSPGRPISVSWLHSAKGQRNVPGCSTCGHRGVERRPFRGATRLLALLEDLIPLAGADRAAVVCPRADQDARGDPRRHVWASSWTIIRRCPRGESLRSCFEGTGAPAAPSRTEPKTPSTRLRSLLAEGLSAPRGGAAAHRIPRPPEKRSLQARHGVAVIRTDALRSWVLPLLAALPGSTPGPS